MSDLINVCGLWLSEKKENKDRHMSGKLRKQDIDALLECIKKSPDGIKFFVFKNNKRPDKKDPDYRVSVAAIDAQPTQQAKPKETFADYKEQQEACDKSFGIDSELPF